MNTDEEQRSYFETQVRAAFDFLIHQFHFEWCGAHVEVPECWAAYESKTTRVTIAFELGAGPWVELERKRRLFSVWSRERYDFAFLLMERAPDQYRRSSIVDLDDSTLPSELRRLSQLLREHAIDVLTGDFAIFPRLRDRATENLRKPRQIDDR
jgi:hypothetical protein